MANGAAAETSLYERLGGVYAIAVVAIAFCLAPADLLLGGSHAR